MLSDLIRSRPLAVSYEEQLLELVAQSLEAVVPPTHAAAVVPSDTQLQPFISRQIIASGAGDIKLLAVADTVPVTLAVAAGVPLLISTCRIWDTGTNATGIVAFY